MRTAILTIASVFAIGVAASPSWLQEKGGENETGPYEVVDKWPAPWAQKGYIWGSQPGVFAETPNRIFIAARGELKLPETLPRTSNGIWGSLNQRATEPKAEMRSCILVVDGAGKTIESWTQWDRLFEGGGGPHKIRINPYDPERHVWFLDRESHTVQEFTRDGKTLLRTLGEKGVTAVDDRHFGRPAEIAWFPDGTFFIADGYQNRRVVKFDKTGKYVTSWGSQGSAPGQFGGVVHCVAVDSNRRVYVADAGNRRIQIFDENGKFLDQWTGLTSPNHIVITQDQSVWVSDLQTARILKYNTSGQLQTYWGLGGTTEGTFQGLHDFHVDSEGNLYLNQALAHRIDKYVPKPGADRNRLVGQPLGTGGSR